METWCRATRHAGRRGDPPATGGQTPPVVLGFVREREVGADADPDADPPGAPPCDLERARDSWDGLY
jgi:hypothetical protein